MTKKNGFTLAEVLITLAIIGVVAAMTIPTLIAKINEKVTENQKKVFEAKVLKGLNLTRTHGDLNNTYSSTYDFLQNGLGKHLKMAKICDASHIRDCVPYDTILYTTSDNKEDSVEVKDIDSAEELGKTEDEGYKDIASFVMGDGTVVIATYKQDCLVDEGKLDRDIGENPCFAGIYDLNGTRKPNKMGKDLLTFNATLNIKKAPAVLATIGEVKIISNAEVPAGTPTSTYCDTSNSDNTQWTVKSEYAKYGITKCCTHPTCQSQGDRWVTAMKTCQDAGGRLPTEAELASIAQELYLKSNGTKPTMLATSSISSLTLQTDKIPSALSGLGSSVQYLWSNSEIGSSNASYRNFTSSSTTWGQTYHYSPAIMAVCVAD